MRAQQSRIWVALGDDLGCYPQEVWDLELNHLDMFTEEVIDELGAIPWAEGDHAPNYSTVTARTGQHNWGASGSYSEIIMQVSTGTAGGIGAAALVAAIKVAYEKLKLRSQGDLWEAMPSDEEAIRLARARLRQHYDVTPDELTVVRTSVDVEAQRHELEFAHVDGRKFGATVGAIAELPSCTRVWAEGSDLVPRPEPEPPTAGT